MGNETSRPESLTFNFEVGGGIITVIAKKSSEVIKETDLVIFNLTDKESIMEKYFMTDILAPFISSPNACDYTLNWIKMNRVMYPVNAKIVKQSQKLVTVQSTELKNTSSETGTFTWNIKKTEIMQEKFKRRWFAESNFTSKIDIAYKILSLGSVNFTRKTTDEEEFEGIKTAKLSSQAEVKVTLEPNRSVRVELQAIYNSIDIEVLYEASLFGYMVVSYGFIRRLGELHSNKIKRIPNVPATATYKEIITLEYYTDGNRINMSEMDH